LSRGEFIIPAPIIELVPVAWALSGALDYLEEVFVDSHSLIDCAGASKLGITSARQREESRPVLRGCESHMSIVPFFIASIATPITNTTETAVAIPDR
jgi:hypothetical protein